MSEAVAARQSTNEVPQSFIDVHSKELEEKNKQAFALVRRLLRDSVSFPMPVQSDARL
ncbi:hypothetical protein D3C87_886110 [compost metagenome]